jgi:hypothetical protein
MIRAVRTSPTYRLTLVVMPEHPAIPPTDDLAEVARVEPLRVVRLGRPIDRCGPRVREPVDEVAHLASWRADR